MAIFGQKTFRLFLSKKKKLRNGEIVRTQNKKLTLPAGFKLFLPILCQLNRRSLVANKKYVFRTTSRQWDGEGDC